MVALLNPKVIVDFTELLRSGIILPDDVAQLLRQQGTQGETVLPEGTNGKTASLITFGSKG